MDTFLEALLAHYRVLGEQNRQYAEALESGKIRLFDGPGYDRDISAETAAERRAAAEDFDRIIAAYEAKRDA
jgi:hypothetical protein